MARKKHAQTIHYNNAMIVVSLFSFNSIKLWFSHSYRLNVAESKTLMCLCQLKWNVWCWSYDTKRMHGTQKTCTLYLITDRASFLPRLFFALRFWIGFTVVNFFTVCHFFVSSHCIACILFLPRLRFVSVTIPNFPMHIWLHLCSYVTDSTAARRISNVSECPLIESTREWRKKYWNSAFIKW